MILGLIGAGIGRSSSPRLHIFLGKLYGTEVDYRSIDSSMIADFDFDATLAACAEEGFRGTNVTHPFKAVVRSRVQVADPHVARIGAINTVTFDADGWRGANTDFTGFVNAFRHRFGSAEPGTVLIIGAGGVGKAMSYSLARLGATEIWLYDIDTASADDLVATLKQAGINATAIAAADLHSAIRKADGLINGTPVGMWTNPGNPFPEEAIGGQRWAFDAVYTPVETEFLTVARARSLDIMSGYELFLFQGFDAFEIFSGISVDPALAIAEFPPPQMKAPESAAS